MILKKDVTNSSGLTLNYLTSIQELLDKAIYNQLETIQQTAQLIANSMAQGGLLHIFGAGHSHMLVEELYGRAGGLTPVNALLVPSLMLHKDMIQATLLERQEEQAKEVLVNQSLQPDDVMLVISNSGRNGLSIELARLARQQRLTVIALTAVEYSKTLSSRHSTGLRLFEIADIVLDNHGLTGDACLVFPGSHIRCGPSSTVVGAALLNAVMAEVIALLMNKGISPPVLTSANMAGPDESSSLAALGRTGQRLSPNGNKSQDE